MPSLLSGVQGPSGLNLSFGGKSPRVAEDAFIAPTAVLIGDVVIGRGAVVAAGSVVREGQEVPPGVLVAGVPAEVKKELSGRSAEWVGLAAGEYQKLQRRYRSKNSPPSGGE